MYHIRAIFLFGLLILSSAFCRAESDPVVHDFGEMSGARTIQYANANKVGKTDLITYKCTGTGAEFNWSEDARRICIVMTKKGDMVTTTAVPNLTQIQVIHYPSNQPYLNLEIRLSYDSVHWTEPLEAERSKGLMYTDFLPGTYYVRMTNTANSKVSLGQITWRFGDPCNCFMYIPE